MQGSFVIANYITVATDSATSIHIGKGHKLLFVKIRQEIHNKMPMLLSEETLLRTAKIL